jgi:hypothetical protein
MATSPEVGHLLDLLVHKQLPTKQDAANARVESAVNRQLAVAASPERRAEARQKCPSIAPAAKTAHSQRGASIGATLRQRVQKVNVGLGWQRSPAIEYTFGVFNGAGIDSNDNDNRKGEAARLVGHPWTGLSLTSEYYRGTAGAKDVARDREGGELAHTFLAGFGLSRREVPQI